MQIISVPDHKALRNGSNLEQDEMTDIPTIPTALVDSAVLEDLWLREGGVSGL
jgi:hypothetical protein